MRPIMQAYQSHFERPMECASNRIVQFPRTAPERKSGVAIALLSLLLLGPLALLGSAQLPKYECVGLKSGATCGHWHRGSR